MAHFNLNAEVAQILAEKAGEPRIRVINGLVEEELTKRAELLMKAVKSRGDLDKEVRKASKVEEVYDSTTRAPIRAHLTKEKLKEIKTAEEKLAKLDKAIAAAAPSKEEEAKGVKVDYKPLKDLLSGGNQ